MSDGQRRDFRIDRSTLTLGRKQTCDLRIPLSSVSREHAQIEQRDEGLFIQDLGSSNGTYLNDEPLEEAQKLEPGDAVRIGPVAFTVVIDGEPADLEPVQTVLPDESDQVSGDSEAGLGGEEEAVAEDARSPRIQRPTPKPRSWEEEDAGAGVETEEPASAPAVQSEAAASEAAETGGGGTGTQAEEDAEVEEIQIDDDEPADDPKAQTTARRSTAEAPAQSGGSEEPAGTGASPDAASGSQEETTGEEEDPISALESLASETDGDLDDDVLSVLNEEEDEEEEDEQRG